MGNPDIIETTDYRLANGNRNTDPRSPIVSRQHRRQRRAMGPMSVPRSAHRLQWHCTETGSSSKPTEKRSFRPDNKNETFVGYARRSDHQTSCACRCCHCQPASVPVKTRMLRSANGRNTTIVDDGKSAECCHGDNYVRWREQYSHVGYDCVVCLRT